jgi:hypothetical protein
MTKEGMVEADATVTEDGRQGHEDVDGLPPTEVAAWGPAAQWT